MNFGGFSLTDGERRILAEYCANHFADFRGEAADDLSFLGFWRSFIEALGRDGAEKAVNGMLVPSRPVRLSRADGISAEIMRAEAGEIPVVTVGDAGDFENVVTNLVHKGVRPANIGSTGAAFVFGRRTRFIILSRKPYSNVSAGTLGLSEDDWLEKSLKIRLEHECAHFFTKRFYGTARNHLHDELVADFFGIVAAFGFYRAEFFERFMGIRGTEGSRLACYIPECSPALLGALSEKASRAAAFLEGLSSDAEFRSLPKAAQIRRLCEADLLLL